MNTQFSNTVIDRIDEEAKDGRSKSFEELCEINRQIKHNWRMQGIPKGYLKFLKAKKPSVFKDLKELEEIEQTSKSKGRKK